MMAPDGVTYRPDYAVPPGETLLEALEDRGMTQAELATRMGRPRKTINEIIKGKTALTAETSIQLEDVLGIPAGFWLVREARYREALARVRAEATLVQEARHAAAFPYSELARRGFVETVRRPEDKAAQLLTFFRVTSLAKLKDIYAPALRVSASYAPSPEALMTWLRIGEILAESIEVAAFDQSRLQQSVPDLRALTLGDPGQARNRLRETMAECGVRLVFVPHLPKTYVHGATRWMSGRPLVQLSARCKWEDIFWFSLFHEVGHILCRHSRKGIMVNWNHDDLKDEVERKADQYATDVLVPPRAYHGFVRDRAFSQARVRRFAGDIGVCPGIVVGRLQHDGLLPRTHLNGLRRRVEILTEDLPHASAPPHLTGGEPADRH